MMLTVEALFQAIERMHYPREVTLLCARWYVAHPVSMRHIEKAMGQRGWSRASAVLSIAMFVPSFGVGKVVR